MASADTTRSAPAQPGRPGETLDYQPVAPAAVLAMAVAGLFTLAVAVLVIVGLTSRKPVIVWELLVVAFLGWFGMMCVRLWRGVGSDPFAVAGAIGFAVVSRAVWTRAIGRYTSASS